MGTDKAQDTENTDKLQNSTTAPCYAFSLDDILGTVDIKTFHKFENGRMFTYSYAIHMERHGIETHRTTPKALSSIGYDSGKPFLEDDYNSIMGRGTKKGFIAKLLGA